ncbi:Bidirectional sugar transporter SWEET3b [Asimina triloba]
MDGAVALPKSSSGLMACCICRKCGIPAALCCTHKLVALVAVPVIATFCVTALVSAFALHDHHHRKVFVGSVGLVASVAMYSSPLVVMKQVIKTKSVEFMPFYLSLFSFLASSLWMCYGLLAHDMFLASPNLLGCPLGFLQLVLYCVYRKKKPTPEKADVEKNSLALISPPEKPNTEKLDLEKNAFAFESKSSKTNGHN